MIAEEVMDYIFSCGCRNSAFKIAYKSGQMRRRVCPDCGYPHVVVERIFVCSVCRHEFGIANGLRAGNPPTCPECRDARRKDRHNRKRRQLTQVRLARQEAGVDGSNSIKHDRPPHGFELHRTVDPVNGRIPGCHGLVGNHEPWQEGLPMAGRR